MAVTASGVRRWQYWTLEPDPDVGAMSDEAYTERFLELFTEAVRCRLRSAFPVGAQLSGGLDSSFVACRARDLLRQGNTGPLHTISCVFDEDASVRRAAVYRGGPGGRGHRAPLRTGRPVRAALQPRRGLRGARRPRRGRQPPPRLGDVPRSAESGRPRCPRTGSTATTPFLTGNSTSKNSRGLGSGTSSPEKWRLRRSDIAMPRTGTASRKR